MKYEVEFPDGMIVRVETIGEVVELRQYFAWEQERPGDQLKRRPRSSFPRGRAPSFGPLGSARKITAPEVGAPDGTFERFSELIVNPKYAVEHQLVALVAGYGTSGVTIPALMDALGITTAGGIGARLGGVGRLCKAANIPKAEIIIKDGSTYRAGAMLLQNIDALPAVPAA